MLLEHTPISTVVDERLRTTSLCLSVDYGSRDDPPGQGGVAHLWEHMALSAPGLTGVSFCECVERLGGQANAETGLEQMLIYAQVHADDADDVAAALLDAVEHPTITSALLETERAVVLQELAAAEADPADVVQDAFLGTLFARHPLGRPVAGTAGEIRSLSLDDVLAAYNTWFSCRPIALVVVGPRIPEPLAGPPAGTSASTRIEPRAATLAGEPGASSVRWPAEFAWTCVGGRSPARGVAGREAYTVLADLLGGSPASLLYRRLRTELGLAYHFEAWDRGYAEAGAWRVMAGVDSGNGDQAVSVITGLLKDLARTGPNPGDLAAAQ